MKKTVSILLAIILIFAMLASFPLIVSAVSAEDAVCEILDTDGETHVEYYDSISTAAGAATSNQTIKLLKNISATGFEFKFGNPALPTDVTFDMNGHSITGTQDGGQIFDTQFCKNLLIKNGSFLDNGSGCNGVKVRHLPAGNGSTHVTFENVTITTNGIALTTAGDNGTEITFKNSYINCRQSALFPASANVTFNVINTFIYRPSSNAKSMFRFDNGYASNFAINIYSGYFFDVAGSAIPVFNIEKTGAVNIYGGTFISAGSGNGFFSNTTGTVDVWGGQFIAHNAGAAIDRGSVSSTIHAATFAAANNGDLGSSGNAYAFGNFTGGFYLKTYGDIPVMTAGASVRLASDHNGLRFETTFSKDLIDYANAQKDGATEIGYGTLIIAANTVYGGLRSYTHYNLSLYATDGSIDFNGADFRDIQATGEGITVNGDESITATAALIEVQSGNLARNFTAVSYIKYTKNGEDVYIYSFVNSADNTRSMSAIASAALADQNAGYTAEQRAVLQTYVVEP